MQDPTLHRRARIQAGRVLGAVGDPRFTPVKAGDVDVIQPDLIEIAGGTATLGSDDEEAYDDEKPPHPTEVATFYLGRYPVTNAEYRCFMEAGGYDDKNYWTPTGWLWRQGELKDSGPVEDILQRRQTVLDNPGLVEQLFQEGRLTPEARDTWENLAEMSEEEARQMVSGWYPVEAHEQPYLWNNPAYNAPNQPVVGVTWYEAMAYCAWLGERLLAQKEDLADLLSGGAWQVRLPTEAEWEWAAGGPEHRQYPWGDEFDVDKTNTLDGRVLGTTPVGAYPGGAATCGALDMSGNVYEWTRSLYQEYPYRQDDGRENPLAEGRRALRGGSWSSYRRNARVPSRYDDLPVFFDGTLGFRVVVAPVIK
jgi:formylglycine-generating enzyme required for sulfatase activity